jgi:hypothetical protein
MKPMLAIILVAIVQQSFAQQILIPYRKSNLFGLSDAKGRLIVAPSYDHKRIQNTIMKSRIPTAATISRAIFIRTILE